MSFVCVLTNGWKLAVDIIFTKTGDQHNIQITTPFEGVNQYFYQVLIGLTKSETI